jgi:hypothetical protein
MNEVEDTRLKEFRQFRKEIRGSKDHLIVGIDVAKEKHHAFFGTATGSLNRWGKRQSNYQVGPLIGAGWVHNSSGVTEWEA